MTKVMNVYVVSEKSTTEIVSKSCWVTFKSPVKVGDSVKLPEDSRKWKVHTVYTGSVLEEVQQIPGAIVGEVVGE